MERINVKESNMRSIESYRALGHTCSVGQALRTVEA